MIADSIALMMMIDVVILAVLGYALWAFRKYQRNSLEKNTRFDFFLISLGMGVISLFYVVDLVSAFVARQLMTKNEAAQLMTSWHAAFEWYLAPIGFVAIVVGFSKCVLHAGKLQHRLEDNQTSLKQMASDAQVAVEKLNQREAELSEKNANFQLALKNMSQGLCVFDADERPVVSNEKYATLYGLSPDLIRPGTPFSDILKYRIENNVIMGDDPKKYIEERFGSISGGKASTTIQRLTDGKIIVIVHRPLPEGGWVATHEDITELAQAESMNQRLARIVENSVNEIYVFDTESLKFLQVNESACKNLGYSKEELLELTPLDLKPNLDRKTFEKMIEPLRTGEKPHLRFETIHRRKDGSDYIAQISLQQITSQNEQVFAAIIEDVTDRKRTERELKRNQELFSKAFHANPIPFSISGPEGEIYDVNEAWLNCVGYTREEAIGNSAVKLGIWAKPEERANFVKLLQKNGVVEGYEAQYRAKNGELGSGPIKGIPSALQL